MLHCRGGCLCPAIFCCFSSSRERVADFYLSVFVCVYVRRGGKSTWFPVLLPCERAGGS